MGLRKRTNNNEDLPKIFWPIGQQVALSKMMIEKRDRSCARGRKVMIILGGHLRHLVDFGSRCTESTHLIIFGAKW